MAKHLSTTFDNFAVSLTEFIDQATVDRYFSEALALYAAGYSVKCVAETITQLLNSHDLNG